jgi:hypothetical protein
MPNFNFFMTITSCGIVVRCTKFFAAANSMPAALISAADSSDAPVLNFYSIDASPRATTIAR